MAFTMASSSAIVLFAGTNANASAAGSGALLEQFSNDAEGLINVTARYDFITKYPNLSSGAQFLLASTAAKAAAMELIAYDMSGYTSRGEAESMINLLNFEVQQNLKLISEDKNRKFMIDGSTGVS